MTFDFQVFRSSSTSEIHEEHTQRPALAGNEIYIDITHSGVCGTDAHYRWVNQGLGHEGVGIVRAVGPDVKTFKIGDRAGWGYINEVCEVCRYCVSGDWIYCEGLGLEGGPKKYGAGNVDQGSMGTGAVWKEPHLFHIPDSMASDVAAPLMCAGVTVWAPLSQYGLKSTDVVGVVGIGGLGHLAIQFANKLGCEVVAFSSTEEKRTEAMSLGAASFVATKGVENLVVPRKINHLLVTTSAMPDWVQFKSVLAPMSMIVSKQLFPAAKNFPRSQSRRDMFQELHLLIGRSKDVSRWLQLRSDVQESLLMLWQYPLTVTDFETKLELPFMTFLLEGWRVIGSTVPSKTVYMQMLEFAAFHGVRPTIDPFPLTKQGVIDSLKKLDEGKMRYRGVLYAAGHEHA